MSGHPVGQLEQQARRALAGTDQMGIGGVGEGPELGQVATAAERRTGTEKVHPRDRRIGNGDGQSFVETLPHGRVIGVVHRRPVQGDDQPGMIAAQYNGVLLLRPGGRCRSGSQPGTEFGTAL